MQTIQPFSATTPAAARFYKFCAQVLVPTQRRHQSSYRRSRSKLNVKPDVAFLPTITETYDHIIYNPPPSMPNVYHTPSIFLPKNDSRRQLQSNMITAGVGSASASQSLNPSTSPEPIPEKPTKKYHVTREQAEEMRALRKEDPAKWSQAQLAKKYDCSIVFVSFVCKGLGRGKDDIQKQVTDYVKSKWGAKKRMAREDRQFRKERWFRDE